MLYTVLLNSEYYSLLTYCNGPCHVITYSNIALVVHVFMCYTVMVTTLLVLTM